MTLKMTEENKEKLNIRLFVYDMEMPLRCDRSDEEYYRKAGKLITETLNTYYSYFKGKKSDKEILYSSSAFCLACAADILPLSGRI
mgnify:CR=1 FL=1